LKIHLQVGSTGKNKTNLEVSEMANANTWQELKAKSEACKEATDRYETVYSRVEVFKSHLRGLYGPEWFFNFSDLTSAERACYEAFSTKLDEALKQKVKSEYEYTVLLAEILAGSKIK